LQPNPAEAAAHIKNSANSGALTFDAAIRVLGAYAVKILSHGSVGMVNDPLVGLKHKGQSSNGKVASIPRSGSAWGEGLQKRQFETFLRCG
jgi:hypothetical protein